jgi:hypothetical protein
MINSRLLAFKSNFIEKYLAVSSRAFIPLAKNNKRPKEPPFEQ